MSLSHIEIITTCCIIAVRVRLINAYRAIGSYRRSKHTKSTTSLKPAAETNNFNPNFRQLRTNGPSMSAAQRTAVHDGLLHPHLRHCSSPASAGWQVTPHHSTWRTAASTPQTLLVASICGPAAAISCSYRDTGVPCSVVGHFL